MFVGGTLCILIFSIAVLGNVKSYYPRIVATSVFVLVFSVILSVTGAKTSEIVMAAAT